MELHTLSFQRGNEAHLRLLKEHPEYIDSNINTFPLHNTMYTVLGFSGGRSLDKELSSGRSLKMPLTLHIRRIMGALDVLEEFHRCGFLHLDISPDNILLIGDGKKERVSLIDFNSVHTLEEIREGGAVYYSAKEGFTAPEIRSGKISAIGFASDLYSLTAVFYTLLTAVRLTALQTVRREVPDITQSPCLSKAPDTVCSMVRKILKRGLTTLTSKRYQTAEQMRLDLEELLDRIEGKGITHPALWETGRANILRAVSTNPALWYIRDEEQLYPIIGETSQGRAISLEKIMNEMISFDGSSVFLLGNGGAGKTTALLRAAFLQPAKYSGIEAAFTYLSLYGWSEEKTDYIKDRILESLKFKPDTESMEMARHELARLLSSPMHTRLGGRPKLIILLDGLNEVQGDTKELLKEIKELSAMDGVRIFLTSRSDIEEIHFPRIYLKPLEEEWVKKILGKNGILAPEDTEMTRLLMSPMMLSIYMRTALEQEKQLFIATQDQLLDSYLKAMLYKEVRDLPENTGERWQIEAALFYVLPELARLMNRKGRALSDEDMLPVVEKSYCRLKKRIIMRVFPEWIGHISDIRGGTINAEEWYGKFVHAILWRRLGLIVRDEQGLYRTAHQLIEEYLVNIQRKFHKKFVCHERVKAVSLAAVCAIALAGTYEWVCLPYLKTVQEEVRVPYDKALAENVLDAAFTAYINCANQYEAFTELLNCLEKPSEDEAEYERLLKKCQSTIKNSRSIKTSQAAGYTRQLLATGEVMPWSGQPLQKETYEAFTALPEQRTEEYAIYLDILTQARADKNVWEYFGRDYLEKLKVLLNADAYMLGKYYNQVIAPELEAMKQSDSREEQLNYTLYVKSYAFAAAQNEITKNAEDPIEIYMEQKSSALNGLRQNGLINIFSASEEEENEKADK